MHWMAANLLGYGLLTVLISGLIKAPVDHWLAILIPLWTLMIAGGQGMVLRPRLPILKGWIMASLWTMVVSTFAISSIASFDRWLLLSVVIYPLALALFQDFALRKSLKSSWVWLPASAIAICLGAFASLIVVAMSYANATEIIQFILAPVVMVMRTHFEQFR